MNIQELLLQCLCMSLDKMLSHLLPVVPQYKILVLAFLFLEL